MAPEPVERKIVFGGDLPPLRAAKPVFYHNGNYISHDFPIEATLWRPQDAGLPGVRARFLAKLDSGDAVLR